MEDYTFGDFSAAKSIIKAYNNGNIENKTMNKILSFFNSIDLTIKNIKNIEDKHYIYNLVKKDKMKLIENMKVSDVIKSHIKNILTAKIRMSLEKE